MSNEPNPPPPALRLKPRLRPAEGSGAGGGAATGEASETAVSSVMSGEAPMADVSVPKIRLRPKLPVAGAPAPAEATGVAPSAVAPPAPPPPPVFVSDAPVAFAPAPAASSNPPYPPASSAGDPIRFKLKAKGPPGAAPAPPVSAPAPKLFITDDAPASPAAETPAVASPPPGFVTSPVPKGEKVKTPPPFPVVAPTRTGRTAPSITVPHLSIRAEVLEPERDLVATEPADEKRGVRVALMALLAVLVLGGGGFFAWQHFMAPPPAAPSPAAKKSSPATAAPQASAPAPGTPASAGPTPSETLNKLAQIPANAINKAQDALAARRASGQTRVDAAALGEDASGRSLGVPPAAPIKAGPVTQSATAMTSVAPGIAATMQVEAAAEASSGFRTFVANARVSGVFQGSPSRAVINGRLTRVGETVDGNLGIIFDGLDTEKRNLIFKDRAGAIVARKY